MHATAYEFGIQHPRHARQGGHEGQVRDDEADSAATSQRSRSGRAKPRKHAPTSDKGPVTQRAKHQHIFRRKSVRAGSWSGEWGKTAGPC